MKKHDERLTWRHFVDCAGYKADCLVHLEEVGEFLKTNAPPGAFTSLAMVDGFLTALVVGPAFPCKENEGIDLILGDTSNERMKDGWTKKERRMFEAVCERCDAIYYYLERNRAMYEPLIGYDYLVGYIEVPSIVEWCRGFVKLFNFCPQAWAPIFRVEMGRTFLAPLIYVGTANDWTNDPNLLSWHRRLAELLPYYVFTIKDFFLMPRFVMETAELEAIVALHRGIP